MVDDAVESRTFNQLRQDSYGLAEFLYKKGYNGKHICVLGGTSYISVCLVAVRRYVSMRMDTRRKIFKSVLEKFGGNLTNIVAGGAALRPEICTCFKEFGINVYQGETCGRGIPADS